MSLTDRSDDDHRPSPEALLEAVAKTRGRLKIFLGAAPGVGKTYEMLSQGAARRRDGVDVVIGVVETHGRAETQALVGGFEIIPRRRAEHRGRSLEEMDLDAILARKPALVLVDELAHSNAPGSRHDKRYQDVEEILDSGIDVWTTLNIQHVESLNDVVARITRIRVRETVPDAWIDGADEIELIDLTPEDLQKRLAEGKVYIRDQARRAVDHFFKPGNLTALRELALRRTAQRVDDQMLGYMRAHAITGPWAAGDRIMVCVSEAPNSEALVRYARRVADRLGARWVAVYIEGSRHHRLGEAERDRIARGLLLAEKLGGETVTVPANDIVAEILTYARRNNITQIVIGKSDRPRWFELLHGSVVHELVRKAGSISVHVMAGEEAEAQAGQERIQTRPADAGLDPRPYLVAAVGVAATTAAAHLVAFVATSNSIALVFLLPVLFCAARYGLGPSIFASLLSVFAVNFFFLPPLYSLVIADPSNVTTLVFFLVVAAVTSNLQSRARLQARGAAARARATAELFGFSRKLAAIASADDLLWAAAYQIASMLKLRVVVLMPQDGSLQVVAGYPPEDRIEEAERAAAQWSWANDRPAGRGADTLPGGKWLFLPWRTASGQIGVVGIDRDQPGPLLSPDDQRLLDSLMDQAAVAIERVRLAKDVDEVRVVAETERLRAALLTSISHDLRTPLASIIGGISSLRQYDATLDPKARGELMETVEDEAERLNRFVGNLLDMTRLESGVLRPKLEATEVAEVIGAAADRVTALVARHRLVLDIAPDLPLTLLDPILLEQVLVNLIDNAAKYAPAGTAITVSARDEKGLVIRVLDEGDGIPEDKLEAIFDKFHRIQQGDSAQAGTGLGLAICRGFVETMGGRIVAGNRGDRRGAVFTVTFPPDLAAPALPGISMGM
ncbi:sensor histidine kinase [Inquilinus limosus]|uniref:histidine kinase n=1 Tax=Inquilinus limosus TaxID=171674 RepID=A0A211ZIB7_9PROT|nr:sensor histidine kinase KdpD [Inquilinus limosus]OWJ65025.1 two-component sensor histidine kinase [Inquilinus limosus]